MDAKTAYRYNLLLQAFKFLRIEKKLYFEVSDAKTEPIRQGDKLNITYFYVTFPCGTYSIGVGFSDEFFEDPTAEDGQQPTELRTKIQQMPDKEAKIVMALMTYFWQNRLRGTYK